MDQIGRESNGIKRLMPHTPKLKSQHQMQFNVAPRTQNLIESAFHKQYSGI